MSETSARRRNATRGFLLALAGTALVSTNYVTAKYGLLGFNAASFSILWTGGAALFALLGVAASGRVKELKLPWRHLRPALLMGLTSVPLMLCAWSGLQLLDPSFAGFLWRFAPIITILFSVAVLGERLRLPEILALAIMVGGGVLSTIGRWHIVGLGVLLTMAACIIAAVQMLLGKMKARDVHPYVLAFYRLAPAAPLLALWAVATRQANFNVPVSYWLVTLLGALLGPCASYFLTFQAYRHWDLARASILRTMEPLLILPLAYAAFHKLPAAQELFGGLLIMTGALLMVRIHLLSSRQT